MSVPCWKVTYSTEKAALSQRHLISKPNRRGHARPMRAYLCKHCRMWHLTSRIRTKPR